MRRLVGLLTALMLVLGGTPVLAAGEAWSRDAFVMLNGKGILQGTNITFENGALPISRGEFAVILDRLLQLPSEYDCTLTDVADSDFYAESVKRMVTNGIAKGKDKNLFAPNDTMTREELAVLLVKAFEYQKGSEVLFAESLDAYTDGAQISGWARESVSKAVFCGLMKGTAETVFDGGRQVTKAEAVQAAANLVLNRLAAKPKLTGTGATTIEQTVRGNTFYEDEEVRFLIHTEQKTIRWEVRDFWRRTIYQGYEEAKNGLINLKLDMDELGYFELTLLGENREGKSVTLITNSFTRVTRYDFDSVNPEESFLGVCTALRKNPTDVLEDALNREIRMLGAKSIRDGSEWKSVEREKGVYAPQLNDAVVEQMAKKYNMDYLYVGGLDNPLYDVNEKTKAAQTPYTDNGREGYANFMKWLALYDGGFYKHLNLYNEWNGPGFGSRGGSPAACKPELYHALAKKTYETVKSASPNTLLAGPSFAGGGFEAGAVFMEQLGELGTLNYLDIIAGNAYNVTTTPDFIAERFANIDRIVREHNNGEAKPIWITETGYPTYAETTETMAGEYTVPLMVNALSVGVDRIFWYNLADYGISETDKEHHFGLMRFPTNSLGAHTMKPSFAALAVLAREITQYQYLEDHSSDAFKWHTFAQGNHVKNVLWAYEKRNVSVRTERPLEVMDFMGNRTTLYPCGGQVRLTLENDPIYIDGAIDGVALDQTFDAACEDTSVNGKLAAVIRMEGIQTDALSAVIDGISYPLTVRDGKVDQTLSLPSKNTADEYDIIVRLCADGRDIGVIKAYVTVAELYDITVVPEITNISNREISLNISLKNQKAESVSVQEIRWSLGGQEHRTSINAELQPHETGKYVIKANVGSYSTKMQLNLSAVVDYQKKQAADVSRTVEFNPNAKVTVSPGVSPEEQLAEAPAIQLADGTFVSLGGGSHSGENDLGGKLWLTWDDGNLYFTAQVKDDRHEIPNTGEKIWGNDSIQMALALDADSLGEEFDRLVDLQLQKDPNFAASNRSNYYEVTISDTMEGPTIWVHKDVAAGSVSYQMTDAQAEIQRDEAAKTTTYWVSFPWSSLPPMDPNQVPEMLMSVLVNDCDSGLRKGYIEWGSGIGQSKNRALFRPFQFVK